MKKLLCIILILCLLTGLAACGGKRGASAATPAPQTAAPQPTPDPTPTPAPTPLPTAAPTEEPVKAWRELYAAFLEENFATLAQACYGFVAGVGFVDLDLDAVPELLLFDAGASSSMGVQFFDIVAGQVVCVSASSVEVGGAFGGEYFRSGLYVNATAFSAFRLKEAPDGTLYFAVTSYNGSEDLRYSELLHFARAGEALELQTVACQQTKLDPETQAEEYTVYTAGDSVIDLNRYGAILSEEAKAADLGYEAAGAFVWESPAYGQDWAGFSAMLSDALERYTPAI